MITIKFNEFIDPQSGISKIRDLGSIYKDVSLNGYNKSFNDRWT